MTKADKELSRLQKNARNKLYRLRKNGVINAKLGDAAVIVKPWNDVQSMTKIEQAQYKRDLRAFNSRENRIERQGNSGEFILQRNRNIAIDAPVVWEFRLLEAERNIQRAVNGNRLEANIAASLDGLTDDELTALLKRNPNSKYERYGGYAPNPPRMNPFNSLENLKNVTRLIAADVNGKHAVTSDRLYNWRKGVISRMKENDYMSDDLEIRLNALSAEQLEYLYEYSMFSSYASDFHYQSELDTGIQDTTKATKDEALEGILLEVSKAEKIKSAVKVPSINEMGL